MRRRPQRAPAFAVAFAVMLGIASWGPTAAAAQAPLSPGERCDDESYWWPGSAAVGGSSPVVDTGVVVPAIEGTTLTVLGVAADGIDADDHATAVDVSVGGALAVPGERITGGRITLSSTSPVPLTVNTANIVVTRCAEVAVDPPSPGTLPATGVAEQRHLVLGAVMVAVGSLMVTLGRRRRPAVA